MNVDISSLIVAVTGIAALVWGIIQANRSRRDTNQQQLAANELSRREQDWEELTAERAVTKVLRKEIEVLHRQFLERDRMVLAHHRWDIEVQRRFPEVGTPPNLFPDE